ncbi:MAG: hypothetical protein KDA83_13175 [Planctomycetales bacterium]|nr:hypothetical protein [Planctomycetales bacterium]
MPGVFWREATALRESIFEDPDFFERVVLGISPAAHESVVPRADSDDSTPATPVTADTAGLETTSALNARAAELDLRELRIRLEHQRLVRHASQISQVLRRRRDAIERRRENWERRDVELESRERAARIWIDHRVADLEEQEQLLAAFDAELKSRAAGLAAWEMQLQTQADQLARQQALWLTNQSEQAGQLEQQSRQLAEQTAQAALHDSVERRETPSELARQDSIESSATPTAEQRKVGTTFRDAETSTGSTTPGESSFEIELRLEQLIRWERELSRLFATDEWNLESDDDSKLSTERARMSLELGAIQSEETASFESASWEHVGHARESSEQADELNSEFASEPSVPSAEEIGAEQRARHLESLLAKWEQLVLSSLEDRVVTQEVHRHLCETCDDATLAQLETPVRERVHRLTEAALDLVDQQRTELAAWLGERAKRLTDWMQAQEERWQTRERRWRGLKQRWLGVDSGTAGPRGPHAFSNPDSPRPTSVSSTRDESR